MKNFLAALALPLALVACGDPDVVSHNNTTVVEVPVENEVDRGGPCGDGTVLNENEVCK